MNALQHIASALRVPAGSGCRCQLCGDSPFDPAGDAASCFGAGFCEWDRRAAPTAEHLCAGCKRVLTGRPGDDPPPLRMRSFAVHHGEFTMLLRAADFWPWLDTPREDEHVLSWAQSKQKHHALYAGISTSERMLIGSDSATVEYIPARDRRLLDAVVDLLASETDKPSVSRSAIVSGAYGAFAIERAGLARWSRCEAVISRYRGQLLLELIASVAPCVTRPLEDDGMIYDDDARAALLLGALARGSALRVSDGKMFWSGFFGHRVARFARLPLRDFVSRMLDELRVDPYSEAAVEVMDALRCYSAEDTAAVEESIRERHGLVVALSYKHRRREE